MNKYKEIVDRHTPKENKLFNFFKAFFVGGFIGLLGQLLMEFFSFMFDIPMKEASTFMMITLIFVSCLLTAFGFFDNIVSKVRAGIIIPITGFAHSMMSSAMEYRKEGFVTGIGANIFKLAGTVILYGVVSAYVFGILRILILGD